jgi:ABC-type amino acid transport substrate-binding protein
MSTRGKPLLVLAWFLLANLSLALAQGWELRVCADPKNLPYSNQAQQGFDNRIAELLAQALGARLTYDWGTQGPSMVDTQLREGRCDLMMSVGEGYRGLLSSVPYYQSSFAFVYREDSPYEITSLDDEVLHHLRIAIETAGVPPFESLANRGLSARAVILEAVDPNDRTRSPIVEAVAKGEVDLSGVQGEGEESTQPAPAAETAQAVVDSLKRILGDQVREVRVSRRLTDSPACLVAGEHDMSPHLARMLKALGQQTPEVKPILEINPAHPLVQRVEQEAGERQADLAQLILDQAILLDGGQLPDPSGFVRRLNALMTQT